MAIQNDWQIDYSNKTITHVSGVTVYTVNEMYSWLMDTFDEIPDLDDDVPMDAFTPSEYSLINSWQIPDLSYRYLKGGAITDTTNNDLWANVYSIGTIASGSQLYIAQSGTVLTTYWPQDHIDVLVKVKASGTLIDSGNITVYNREYGKRYDHFEANVSTGGRTPIPLSTSTDLDNQTASGTVATWTDVTITFGDVSKELNPGFPKPYKVTVNCGGRTLSQVYERLKYVTRREATATLNSIEGRQYQKAVSSYSPEKTAPFGTFAGGKFFGARGVWIENYNVADVKNFQLIDANGDVQTPPNVVGITATDVIAGYRVALYRRSGSNIVKNDVVAAAGNNSGNSTLVASTNIPTDIPTAGTVIIGDDRYTYTSYTSATFTLSTNLTKNYSAGTAIYVPFIEQQASGTTVSTTITYGGSDIPVRLVARKKGYKPFKVDSAITNVGLSIAVIKTVDNIVT